MDHFIRRENIAHFRRLLAEADVTTDQVRQRADPAIGCGNGQGLGGAPSKVSR